MTSNVQKEDQIRSSIALSVTRIGEEECVKSGATLSSESIQLMTQFVYHFAKHCMAPDMEHFARHRLQNHRKHTMVEILPSDVLLCARKSPSTTDSLVEYQKRQLKRTGRNKKVDAAQQIQDIDFEDDDAFGMLDKYGEDKDEEEESGQEEERPKKKSKLVLRKNV
ncbi:mediator of RNA polymerase II transcription subunit 13 [Acrasis kona]|uniref:Mediator of RNA polymerase II transcription subunit 13 n=1 Tax=Acrasis kona TaxID=1008807 RepID=A0AAW2YZD4_9EUKA